MGRWIIGKEITRGTKNRQWNRKKNKNHEKEKEEERKDREEDRSRDGKEDETGIKRIKGRVDDKYIALCTSKVVNLSNSSPSTVRNC